MRHNNAEKIDLIFEVLVYKVNLENKNRVLANSLTTFYIMKHMFIQSKKIVYQR